MESKEAELQVRANHCRHMPVFHMLKVADLFSIGWLTLNVLHWVGHRHAHSSCLCIQFVSGWLYFAVSAKMCYKREAAVTSSNSSFSLITHVVCL